MSESCQNLSSWIESFRSRTAMFALFSLAVIGASGVWSVIDKSQFEILPIRFVRAQGAIQYARSDTLKQAILPYVNAGFLSLDLQHIQRSVEQIAWIRRARVRRIWPDTVVVDVVEQRPFVRWRNYGLLNDAGDCFTPPSKLEQFAYLPAIYGPEGQERELLEHLKQIQKDTNSLGVQVVRLDVNERLSWSIRLSNGLSVEIGRKRPILVLQRFLETLPLLGEQQIQAMESVDLRYPNGYAVRWKPGTELEWGSWVNQQSDQPEYPRRSI